MSRTIISRVERLEAENATGIVLIATEENEALDAALERLGIERRAEVVYIPVTERERGL